jgi:hypothetical protein
MAKMMYRKDTGDIVGVHMIGLHSADNIHEFSNAMNMGLTLRDLKFNVHAHPTVAEVTSRSCRHMLWAGGWVDGMHPCFLAGGVVQQHSMDWCHGVDTSCCPDTFPACPPACRPACLQVNEELIRHAVLEKVAAVKPAAAKQTVAA